MDSHTIHVERSKAELLSQQRPLLSIELTSVEGRIECMKYHVHPGYRPPILLSLIHSLGQLQPTLLSVVASLEKPVGILAIRQCRPGRAVAEVAWLEEGLRGSFFGDFEELSIEDVGKDHDVIQKIF